PLAGGSGPLPGGAGRAGGPAAAAAGAVRRLRRLAAGVARRRGARRAAGLLAPTARGGPGLARAAGGPAPPPPAAPPGPGPAAPPLGLTRTLQSLGRGERSTLFMVLVAAFAALLRRYSRQEDLVVGTPIAGRDHAELEGLVGLFLNTLALRLKTPGDWSFAD